jgi:hypothetical protein
VGRDTDWKSRQVSKALTAENAENARTRRDKNVGLRRIESSETRRATATDFHPVVTTHARSKVVFLCGLCGEVFVTAAVRSARESGRSPDRKASANDRSRLSGATEAIG